MCYLGDTGVTPRSFSGRFTSDFFRVKLDRDTIVGFEQWLRESNNDTTSAALLRKEFPAWFRAERNPNAPDFAMKLDDVTYGGSVISIQRNRMIERDRTMLKMDTLYEGTTDSHGDVRHTSLEHRNGCYTAAYDIVPWSGHRNGQGPWSDAFSVVNTPANRKLLLAWLLEGGYNGAAQQLIETYPELVKTAVTVKNGKLIADATVM